jgi:hypothetical protein
MHRRRSREMDQNTEDSNLLPKIPIDHQTKFACKHNFCKWTGGVKSKEDEGRDGFRGDADADT